MPEQNSVSLLGAITGAIGFILGIGMSLIGLGKKIERVESGVARSHERHDMHEKKYDSLEQAIKTLTSVFTRDDGEPRFTTSISCVSKQTECHAAMTEKFSAGVKRFGDLEKKIEEIKMAQSQNFQDIINEIRANKP